MRDAGKLVVARFPDGRLVAGRIAEFRAESETCWIMDDDGAWTKVSTLELKALFFVRSLPGDATRRESREFPSHSMGGTKTWVEFLDGEEMAGWQISARPLDDGLFLFPTDPESNVEKAFIPRTSLRRVLQGPEAEAAARAYNEGRPPGGPMIRPDRWEDLIRAG